MSLLLQPLAPAQIGAIAVGHRYRGSANGWNSAVGVVEAIERDGLGHAMRISMLREGGSSPAWFYPSDLRSAD